MTTISADPLAPAGAQFALSGSTSICARSQPTAARPWGLRHLRPALPARPAPAWSYDDDRQVAVDADGIPLVAGDPTAVSTASVDGEDPPSSEDWVND